jgi:Fur family zinc uptake transcriptional regulator
MTIPLFPPPGHDHDVCVERTLERARAVCARKGVRLTALRERVLREIASSHTAVGAYDIIDRLAREGRRLAPISVYRIIDVLAEMGLVHRLESRNAYFACQADHFAPEDERQRHGRGSKRLPGGDLLLLLLCNHCGRVAEAPAQTPQLAIHDLARSLGFTITGSVLELQGLCPDCSAAVSGAPS